jgi:HK97 family phage prohead protease
MIEGYAAVFNELSEDLGGFRELVAPGAFKRSVEDNDVRALWDHNSQYVLGRNRAGTLALDEDDTGLRITIVPPDTTWAADLIHSMKRGDINQMSFGFYKRADEWDYKTTPPTRTLRDVDLFDVSIVTYPAYPQTSAEARSKAATDSQAAPVAEEEQAEDVPSQARPVNRKHRIQLKQREVAP